MGRVGTGCAAIVIRSGARLTRCTICIGGNTDAGNFQGHENRIVVGRDSHLTHTKIEGHGSDNVLEIGERVYVVHRALFLLHGHRCEIRVGDRTSIQPAFLSAGECGTRITIGRDCMLAHGVVIATTDCHAVLEDSTGRRTNPAASVYIGDHVWFPERVSVVTCLQVTEHIRDVRPFVDALFAVANQYVLISVPYQWPTGLCRQHVHDPIDDAKLERMTGRTPQTTTLTAEKATRMVAVYEAV